MALHVHTDPVIEDLTIDGEQIETTPHHPFYTLEHGWVDAGNLKVGDHVRKADVSYGVVQKIVLRQHLQQMYNLTVETAHTFFVGSGQWLAHNVECPRLDIPQDGPNGRQMFGQAKEFLKAADPSARQNWMDDFIEQIMNADNGWVGKKSLLPDGGAMYTGDTKPWAFVISPAGDMYQLPNYLEVTDLGGGLNAELKPLTETPLFRMRYGRAIPIYENLAKSNWGLSK